MDSAREIRIDKLRCFCNKNEITLMAVNKLLQLEDYDIVCLCDDSGSMSTAVDQGNASDPFGKRKTRWDELCESMLIVGELATTLGKDGIDIYFLNRSQLTSVTSVEQIQPAFSTPPLGYTPIVPSIQQILKEKSDTLTEKKILLVLFTDGEPTSTTGEVQIDDFLACIRDKPSNLYVSIVACTDDSSILEYLNMLDKDIPGVDVCDDFNSERKQIMEKTGFSLSFGDYICKILLGPIDSTFGDLDIDTLKRKSGDELTSESDKKLKQAEETVNTEQEK